MSYQTLKTPAGETLVVLPLAEFEALRDAADAAHAAAEIARVEAGAETFSDEEAAAFVEAASPVAFFRQRRGLSQVALARAAGLSQSYLAGIESGARKGSAEHLKRLAEALGVRMEMLVA